MELPTQARRSELLQRYGIGKTMFYEWLKYLDIQARKDRQRRAYFTAEHVRQLDALHRYYCDRGRIEGFLEAQRSVTLPEESVVHPQKTADASSSGSGYREQQFAQLMRLAQEWKAGVEVAKYAIAANLNDDDLPDDLRAAVERAKAESLPKSQSVEALAEEILSWSNSLR
ncbi:hypothetical protein KR51_00021390 [Rubidibacter lacunae KORDI 51-2]|uniref:Uncharacterized protein n=1 Tax=Rubidibacter lacunae KORDI 51-2 TaxID=582515 RepID=U5DHW6_9CHRO|nr:hypothetical protein [Rubidibacter lacunae]ERN41251.1 hypothetical protein KR51_00021390 [Rubidibacter lacunae KORDI 51-2]